MYNSSMQQRTQITMFDDDCSKCKNSDSTEETHDIDCVYCEIFDDDDDEDDFIMYDDGSM